MAMMAPTVQRLPHLLGHLTAVHLCLQRRQLRLRLLLLRHPPRRAHHLRPLRRLRLVRFPIYWPVQKTKFVYL